MTRKSFRKKKRKTLYEKILCKPFSKTCVRLFTSFHASALSLCSLFLLSFSLTANNAPLRSLAQKTPLKHKQKLEWPTKHDDRGEVRSCETRHGATRRGERARSHELFFFFFFFKIYQICCSWVWLLPVLGYGVSGDGFRCCRWFWSWWDLVDFEFDFWFCAVGLSGFWVDFGGGLACGRLQGGSRWVAGWLTVGLWGGSRWWFPFLVDSGGFGCGYFLFFCFLLLQTHNIKYLSEHFPRMQTNTENQSFFLKSFTFTNILHCKIFFNETNGLKSQIYQGNLGFYKNIKGILGRLVKKSLNLNPFPPIPPNFGGMKIQGLEGIGRNECFQSLHLNSQRREWFLSLPFLST